MRTMKHWTAKRLAIGACALLVAAATGAGAYAATSSRAQAGPAGLGRAAIVSAVTSELGINAQQLRTDLASGETLSQIASANGGSAAGVEQAILGVVQSRIDNAVSSGKLSTQQGRALLTRAGTVVDKLVGVEHPVAHLQLLRLRLGVLRVAAGYIGVTPAQLRSEIKSGTSLSQIMTTSGKSAAGLQQAVVTAVTTRLDKAVSAGTITSTREQVLLSRLEQRLGHILGQSTSS